jgi:catechol 2,3-dioxygenase-like lactoylglutathione lyase family enzyme
MNNPFPDQGMAITHILVVSDIEKSKKFYKDVLGADVYREYGGTSCVFSFLDSWLLIVTGGDPTKDKPSIAFKAPGNINSVSHAMTIRVPDCQKSYQILKERGAKFITPPVDWTSEIRCFFHDPDGHLFEISQSI